MNKIDKLSLLLLLFFLTRQFKNFHRIKLWFGNFDQSNDITLNIILIFLKNKHKHSNNFQSGKSIIKSFF